MSKQTQEIWESRYQKKQTGWDRGKPSEGLQYWLNSGLLAPCRILIPGCGNGYEVLALAAKGFQVTAVDIAPTPIQNLRVALNKAGLSAELVQEDFFKWQPEQPFEAIFEQTSLCALPPDLWQQYEKQLYRWLKPKGVLLAQFMQTKQGDGPPYHCKIKDMRALFSQHRWQWSKQYNALEKTTVGKAELMYMLVKN